jgi:ABC-type uncharacterized transport system substrate-binding protein
MSGLGRREFVALLGGAVATWPVAARAQQSAMPVVGFLHPGTPAGYAPIATALRQGLSEAGFVDGRNLAIEYRWGADHVERLPALAAELVARRVAVIIAGGGTAAVAAKAATATIPIVFSIGADPIELGLVASFNHRGGNVTGMFQFNNALLVKRLEMMRELVPGAALIGLLVDPSGAETQRRSASLLEAARAVGQRILVLSATNQEQFEEVFATAVRERIDGLLVGNAVVFTNGREHLVALAARYAVPASYEYREFVAAGGLFSYGASHTNEYRQVGVYAGRVLKGEKPADMPVTQTTKFELIVNLKTAEALGLELPPSLLARADEVIE